MSRPATLPRRQGKSHALLPFGRYVSKEVRQELLRRVWKGDVKSARKLTASRSVIVLDHGGAEMTFLYSSVTKDILSFLPPGGAGVAARRGGQL